MRNISPNLFSSQFTPVGCLSQRRIPIDRFAWFYRKRIEALPPRKRQWLRTKSTEKTKPSEKEIHRETERHWEQRSLKRPRLNETKSVCFGHRRIVDQSTRRGTLYMNLLSGLKKRIIFHDRDPPVFTVYTDDDLFEFPGKLERVTRLIYTFIYAL